MKTRIVPIGGSRVGHFVEGPALGRLDSWEAESPDGTNESDLLALQDAALYLRTREIPVAFPTETVYGLAADATRSDAVRGIYNAKGRPSDNPLIVHVCDLQMLRRLIRPYYEGESNLPDPIPVIYRSLIERFWPGPLTILLPNPPNTLLAPEVTAGQPNFGARMPSTPLALSLIKLTGRPLAAPSANASTKPSPTAARHVLDDLDGRIEIILDGGACTVGVESTVVDGLSNPPVVLRPGGVSIEELKTCPGWEGVTKAYRDQAEEGKVAPRAPGMKYKHYSPKAKVVLYEASFLQGRAGITQQDIQTVLAGETIEMPKPNKIGIIRTRNWKQGAGLSCGPLSKVGYEKVKGQDQDQESFEILEGEILGPDQAKAGSIADIDLGRDTREIAQGLFSALRELDRLGVGIIFVEGIDDGADIAGAVMNRLRKAATEIRS